MSEAMRVEFHEEGHHGRFRLRRGDATVGEMTFSRVAVDQVIVDHTETDDAIRGLGGGKQLFRDLVAWARRTGTRVRATCPFVIAQFAKHPDAGDVYEG